jgi:hypothetical protein
VIFGLSFLSTHCDGGKFAQDGAVQKTLTAAKASPANPESTPSNSDDAVPQDDKGKGGEKIVGSSDDEAADADSCSDIKGKDLRRLKVSGSESTVTLQGEDGVLLKVSGSQNKVSMTVAGSAQQSHLSALCLDITGDQNQISVEKSRRKLTRSS